MESVVSASSELLGVAALPVRTARGFGAVGSPALNAQASLFLAGGGQAAQVTTVVLLGDDPVDAGIILDGSMGRVHNDDFEEFVGSILAHPVGVEDAHVGASAANLLLSDGSV